jgi:hypothetical protein
MVNTAPGLETGLLTARYRVPFPTSLKNKMSSMKLNNSTVTYSLHPLALKNCKNKKATNHVPNNIKNICIRNSVPDPDPYDLYVLGPPGFASGSDRVVFKEAVLYLS